MKSDGRRIHRAEREVHHLVAQYLIQGFKGHLPGLVTVSRVQMPADFRTANVYITVFGEEDSSLAIKNLQARAFEIQHHLSQKLKMRNCPRIRFHLDEAAQKALKLEQVFHEIQQESNRPC